MKNNRVPKGYRLLRLGEFIPQSFYALYKSKKGISRNLRDYGYYNNDIPPTRLSREHNHYFIITKTKH